jgi:hypothetical protein
MVFNMGLILLFFTSGVRSGFGGAGVGGPRRAHWRELLVLDIAEQRSITLILEQGNPANHIFRAASTRSVTLLHYPMRPDPSETLLMSLNVKPCIHANLPATKPTATPARTSPR